MINFCYTLQSAKNFCAVLLLIPAFMLFSNAAHAQDSTKISGLISVDPELDESRDYSGIGVTIILLGTENVVDTLYHAVTKVDGTFSGVAEFPGKDQYLMMISRNQRTLYSSSIVLQADDEITIQGELPHFENTRQVTSFENNAMTNLNRIERNYNRIVDFINYGEVEQDTIPTLIHTWSDLFWSVQDSYPNTLASDMGKLRSVEILNGWHDDLMLQRIDESMAEGTRYKVEKATFAAGAIIRKENLRAGIAYIDSVSATFDSREKQLDLKMLKTELYLDHNYISDAINTLRVIERDYTVYEELQGWIDFTMYDLENLSKGHRMPEFNLDLLFEDGDVSNESLADKVYLFEIVNLADRGYQLEYNLMLMLYGDYHEKGLEFVSVPINDSGVLVRAFYEERGLFWNVGSPISLAEQDLVETLNIGTVPTRFLVDSNGLIVRKYSGTDISIIQNDIKELLDEENL